MSFISSMTFFYNSRGFWPLDFLDSVILWDFPVDSCEAATGRENLLSKPVTRLHDLSSPISFSSQSIGPLLTSPAADSEPGGLLFSFAVDGQWPLCEAQPAHMATSPPQQVTPPHWGRCTNHIQRENDENTERSWVMWGQRGGRRPEKCLLSTFNSWQEGESEKNSWQASSDVDIIHPVDLFAFAWI